MKLTAVEFKSDRFERVRITRPREGEREQALVVIAYRHAQLERTAIRRDFPYDVRASASRRGQSYVSTLCQHILEMTCNVDEWGDDEVDALASAIDLL
jgi:hypothetical protein